MSDGVPLGEMVGSHGAAKPIPVTLEGRSVTLAPISASHVPSLYQTICVDSPDAVFAYMFAGPFDSEEPFRKHVEAMVVSEDPLFFTVIPKEPLPGLPAGMPAGYLSLMRVDVKNRAVEIGHITLSQALQRTTAATEALYLAMKHCMEDLGYRRLEWKCHSLNAKSIKAAGRFGFVFEGIFRKHLIVRGRNRDTAWYSIVDDEWKTRKDAFEKWLEPGNFKEGKQVKSLTEIRKELEEA
jgi:RimJ/RimL family protein N-acetyltransferase